MSFSLQAIDGLQEEPTLRVWLFKLAPEMMYP